MRFNLRKYHREFNIKGRIVQPERDGDVFYIETHSAAERAYLETKYGEYIGDLEGETGPALQVAKETVDDIEADDRTHELNVSKAKELIETVTDIPTLNRLHASEMNHPEYPGGRSSVLRRIGERITELIK